MADIYLIGLIIGFLGSIYYIIFIKPKKDILFWYSYKIYCSYYMAAIFFLGVVGLLILNISEVISLSDFVISKITYVWGGASFICSYNEHIKLIILRQNNLLIRENDINSMKFQRMGHLVAGLFWITATHILNL